MVPVRERSQFIDAVRTKILLEVALKPPAQVPVQVIPAQVIPAQVEAPRVSCLYGERMWQQRWGN